MTAPAEAVAAVQPDGEAPGRSVGRDAAVVRHELLIRILGGDADLHRHAAALDRVLRGNGQRGLVQEVPVGDEDLALHEVDARDHLRHGVLHLDAGIHLDEVELTAVHVDQELHRSGAL